MDFTKEELESMRKDPLMNFFANLLGTNIEEVIKEAEKEKSHANEIKPVTVAVKEEPKEEHDEIEERVKRFFDRLVEKGDATVKVEDGRPHYSIKLEDGYKEPEKPEELLEEESTLPMSKEDLKKFIDSYTKLENTVHKLEHVYGIDLNTNADSIYTQYNAIIWDLIDKLFGSDNRDDIADYIFGDSNFDSVDDLYEELV